MDQIDVNTKRISYTAANALPLKIFKNFQLVQKINEHFIPPIHVQLIPTNKCNLNCSFCSCSKRNKSDELSMSQIEELCASLHDLGCVSATITGGGEPLMHRNISDILQCLTDYKIKIGLVSNGLLLSRLSASDFDNVAWCRISCSDERPFTDLYKHISHAVAAGNHTDWAFSYVVSKNPNADNLNAYIKFANKHNFTHVRVVSDLLDLENVTDMDVIKRLVTTDDSRVIYQGRKQFDPGAKRCWISLLKPVVGADGYIYPCCGVQYAHQEEDLDNPASMRMGRIENIIDVVLRQSPFDGLQCHRCYYDNYNRVLESMLSQIDHEMFV